MTRKRFVPTERDREIVKWIAEVQVAKREHVQAVFFGPGGRARCQDRLKVLSENKYLDRLPRRAPTDPFVYYVSRRSLKGLRLLRVAAPERARATQVNSLRLRHALDLVSCRVQMTVGCKASGMKLLSWHTSAELLPVTGVAGVLPDGFFKLSRRVAGGREVKSSFFLEVERSDKSDRALSEKLRRYGEYYYGGDFTRAFASRALRVLVLFGSDYGILPERRVAKLANLAERLGVTFIHATSLSAFLALSPPEVLSSPIWLRAGREGRVSLFEAAGSTQGGRER
jgi:hypothetical protein